MVETTIWVDEILIPW